MAGTKKATKKTTARKTTARKEPTIVEQVVRAQADGFAQGVAQSRGDVTTFLMNLNDPAAITVLDKLRAKWVDEPTAVASRDVRFEVYIDKMNEHRWRARAGNGQIIADSGEGYASEGNAERAMARFIALVKML